MTDIPAHPDPIKEAADKGRERLRDLNTKAYYLLVALAFIYGTRPGWPLTLAMTLIGLVAVLPLQDYGKADLAKTPTRQRRILRFKVIVLTLALWFTVWDVWKFSLLWGTAGLVFVIAVLWYLQYALSQSSRLSITVHKVLG